MHTIFFSGYYWYCGYAVFNLIQTLVASVWVTLSLEGKAKTIILHIEYTDLINQYMFILGRVTRFC